MQLRVGSVAALNGDSVVRGLYVVTLTGVVGSELAEGEEVVWGADGDGLVSRHDTTASKLYFYRTAGVIPTVATVVRNVPNTKSGTISSFGTDSVPDFASELSGPGGPKLFTVVGSGVFYNIDSAGVDSVTLNGNYIGDTDREATYAIARDYDTFFGWVLPAPSDIDLASLLNRIVASVSSSLYGPATITPTLGTNWSNGAASAIRYWKDADRVVHLAGKAVNAVSSVPSIIFTLPVGYRPLYACRMPIIVGTTSMGVLEITTAGEVTVLLGTLSAAVYLDGITFRAEA